MNYLSKLLLALCGVAFPFAGCASHPVPDDPRWLTYRGGDGPGSGRHIVLVAAEQEYRAEQALPMLADVLATRHGFDCTVLFLQNEQGLVDPTLPTRPQVKDIWHDVPGLEHLASADLLVLFSRFLTLRDESVRHVIDYLESGKPVIGIRTANHGFRGNFPYEIDGKRVRFGLDVLGGTFRGHHGGWHRESTLGTPVAEHRDHPILRGVDKVWGPSDVYRTYPKDGALRADCTPLVIGQPLKTLDPDSAPTPKKVPLPVAWTTTWRGSRGLDARVFHTTMGSAQDYRDPGMRRLTVNAVYWCLGLEERIDPARSVAPVTDYDPLRSGFNYEKLGVVPRPPASFR
ncbi:MAG: ThuA domain-containing protein [bacterium]|nr:ThuA domain-containing protein [bacterium]